METALAEGDSTEGRTFRVRRMSFLMDIFYQTLILVGWTFIVSLVTLKIKSKNPPLKFVRVIGLDDEVSEDILKYICGKLRKEELFSHLKFFYEFYDKNGQYSSLESLFEKDRRIFVKVLTKEITNYDNYKNNKMARCINYERFLKQIKKVLNNEEIGEIYLTTYAIKLGKNYSAGTNTGTSHEKDIFLTNKIKKFFTKSKSFLLNKEERIGLVSYQEDKKEKGEIFELVAHQLAHLLEIDNHKFSCE